MTKEEVLNTINSWLEDRYGSYERINQEELENFINSLNYDNLKEVYPNFFLDGKNKELKIRITGLLDEHKFSFNLN